MTCSSMMLRSFVIVGSFALLALSACERDNAQPEGAEGDVTGAAVGSAGSGAGMRARDDSAGAGIERGSATGTAADETGLEAIQRTSGEEVPLGSGGSAGKTGGAAGRGGSTGRGGAGGTTAKP